MVEAVAMKDEWLLAAMADDKMVAELLLRLKESDPHPSAFARQAGAAVAALLASLPPFEWATRHPRSKAPAAAASASASASAGKKDRERTRRSPTTPLSWSACGVGSAGASPSDGFEDSSRPPDRLLSAVRSKATAANETTTTSTPATKRPRRKKTFAELKDEESSLMKDRAHLKMELDALRNKLEEARSVNEKLKRIKLDASHVPTVSKPRHGKEEKNELGMEASTSTTPWSSSPKQAKPGRTTDSQDSCPAQNRSKKEAWVEEASFVLPDLNMMPEEDSFPGKTLATS